MRKFYRPLKFFLLGAFTWLCSAYVMAQPVVTTQRLGGYLSEDLWRISEGHWENTLSGILAAGKTEFRQFLEYNEEAFYKDRAAFFYDVSKGIIATDNADKFFDTLTVKYVSLYRNFRQLKAKTPGAINDDIKARQAPPPPVVQSACNPSCFNINFQDSTLNGWSAYWGIDVSTQASIVVNNITGGACGSVTQAAGPDPNTMNSYHVNLMTTPGSDPIAGGLIPYTPPLGGICAMVGDGPYPVLGVGILQQSYIVSASNPILTIQYAVVLENPNHPGFTQPWFKFEVLDQNGTPIPGCGQYFVLSGPNIPGFNGIPYGGDTVYCKPWTTAFVPLGSYIGQCVTVKFTASDCAYGGHFGYAYVACTCSKLNLVTSSNVFCVGQKSATITGPPGAASYQWSTPNGCISGSGTQQVLNVTCAGTYNLVTVSSAGPQCVDTFSITIPPSPAGPPPIPCFTFDTACSGTPTHLNAGCSNPNNGAKFYWDFYNNGLYEDSSGTTPNYTYSTGGYYPIRLHEVAANGCSVDTVITVPVDSTNTYSIPTFNVTTVNATACNLCNGSITLQVTRSSTKIIISDSFDNTVDTIGGPTSIISSGGNKLCKISINNLGTSLTFCNMCPGNYYIYIRPVTPLPPSKCAPGGLIGDTLLATVNANGVNITSNILTSPATCGKNNGSVSVTGTGGASPYTYKWSSGLGTNSTVSGLAGGTYSVTIQDANGCFGTTNVNILSSPKLTALITPYYVNCYGAHDGSIKIIPTSGSAPYTFNWSPSVSNTDSAGGLAPGIYSVTITDSGGCSGTVTTVINQPAQLRDSISGSYINLPCHTTGNAAVHVSGGYTPYTYRWSNGATTQNDTGLVTGTYIITITDATGCVSHDSIKVSVNICATIPVAQFNSSDTAFCNETGKCIDFFDRTTNNPTSWKWLFPGAVPDTSSQQNPTGICYYIPGTYAVTLIATNAAGSDTLIVSPMITLGQTPPAPSITRIGGDTLVCSHASYYQWFFNGGPISGATDSFYVAINHGTYNIYITDSLGCSRLGNGILFISVNELGGQSMVSIYPNPSISSFIFQLNQLVKNAEAVIYDMLGKEVWRKKMNGTRMEIEKGSLESGVYFVRVRSEEWEWVGKLIIE